MEDYNKEYYWEFYLRDNPLTKDNTKDCIAEVKNRSENPDQRRYGPGNQAHRLRAEVADHSFGNVAGQ